MNDSTPQTRAELIASLTEEVTPVSVVKPGHGALAMSAATVIAALASLAIFGFWTGMITGAASGYFWITNGLLAMLGATSTAALAASVLPRVGTRSSAPVWGTAMIGVLPVAGLMSVVSTLGVDEAVPVLWHWECAVYGLVAGLTVAIAAIAFLRRGAPVALERVGWLTGIASGSLGSLAYGITCPLDTVAHVGIVHIAPVFIAAVIGRLVVPPIIRW